MVSVPTAKNVKPTQLRPPGGTPMVSTDAARRTAAMGGKEELAVAQGLADAASGVTDVARQFAGANVALKNAEAAIKERADGNNRLRILREYRITESELLATMIEGGNLTDDEQIKTNQAALEGNYQKFFEKHANGTAGSQAKLAKKMSAISLGSLKSLSDESIAAGVAQQEDEIRLTTNTAASDIRENPTHTNVDGIKESRFGEVILNAWGELDALGMKGEALVAAKQRLKVDVGRTIIDDQIKAARLEPDDNARRRMFEDIRDFVEELSWGIEPEEQERLHKLVDEGEAPEDEQTVNGIPMSVWETFDKPTQTRILGGAEPQAQLIKGLPKEVWDQFTREEQKRIANADEKEPQVKGIPKDMWDKMSKEQQDMVLFGERTLKKVVDPTNATQSVWRYSDDAVNRRAPQAASLIQWNNLPRISDADWKRAEKFEDIAQESKKDLTQLKLVSTAVESKRFEPGPFGDVRGSLSRWAEMFGMDPELRRQLKLGDSMAYEAIRSGSSRLTIAMADKLSRVTNLSIILAKESVTSALLTPKGNLLISKLLSSQANRDVENAILAGEFLQEFSSFYPDKDEHPDAKTFFEVMHDRDVANPVFTPELEAELRGYADKGVEAEAPEGYEAPEGWSFDSYDGEFVFIKKDGKTARIKWPPGDDE